MPTLAGNWTANRRCRPNLPGAVLKYPSGNRRWVMPYRSVTTDRGRGTAFPERALLIRVEPDQPIQKRPALVNRLHTNALVQPMNVPTIGVSKDAGDPIRRYARRI